MRSSFAKGRALELEVVNKLRDAGIECEHIGLQNENQRITITKLTLPDISDSKSVNVISDTEADNTCD
ncbi:635_t:CDS:2 [Entrophospora sp. SA101]|nr:635_t:CDS:2 [Entrophospora sp. SA101]